MKTYKELVENLTVAEAASYKTRWILKTAYKGKPEDVEVTDSVDYTATMKDVDAEIADLEKAGYTVFQLFDAKGKELKHKMLDDTYFGRFPFKGYKEKR
jgi:hypothetical protein